MDIKGIQNAERAVPTASGQTRATRLLVAVLVVLTAIAIVVNYRHLKSHSIEARLHGDSDEATGALAEVLLHTPDSQRSALLLKSVTDPSPSLRYAAVDALGNEQSPAAVEAVERAFQDSSSMVRQRAMEVLPNLDRERGLRIQLAGLRDEDSWVREAAVRQMATNYGKSLSQAEKRAVPMLIKTLEDPDPDIVFMTVGVLYKLTGKPWHYKKHAPAAEKQAVFAQWRRWWAQAQATWPVSADYRDVPPRHPMRTDPAPDFSLRDLDKQTLSLSGQEGRITLLNFWGTWCPPCQFEVPDLVQVHEGYHGRGVDIVGIALGEKKGAEGVRAWCHDHGVPYRQALATDEVCEVFGDIHDLPVSILIDRQGRIRYRWEGERDFATFKAAVERLLAE
jgi:peroxiredoxin